MPRDSALSPPVTTCLPRNTSPSRVTTGNCTVGAIRDADSNESAISAPPITAWMACGNGPPIRITDDSVTDPEGALISCTPPSAVRVGAGVGIDAGVELPNIERNDDTKP